MKGLWILGGLVAAAIALAWLLGRESTADLERLHAATVRDRPAIAAALEECGDLVRFLSDIKPTERKKGELEELRRRFEKLERTAAAAMEGGAAGGDAASRDERKRTLARIEGDFHSLLVDAEDLRARLREMKNFLDQLQPRIAKLGQLTQQLLQAQAEESPEFQQRAGQLIEEGREFRLMAEGALRTLSVKILDGRTTGMTALNELDATLKNMEELLAARGAAQQPADAKGGG
jgi:hypothetical protein